MGIRIAAVVAVVALSGCSVAPPEGSPGIGIPTASRASTPSVAESQADAVRVHAQDTRNEQDAEHEAALLLASMPHLVGSRSVPGSQVPPLTQSSTTLSGPDLLVNQTGFWVVPSANAHAVAEWYTRNTPAGMKADGGIGGSRNNDGSSSYDVFYNGIPTGPAPDSGALIEVTPLGTRVGVRVTIYNSWRPTRPLLSFAPGDVSAVQIKVTRDAHRRVFTVTVSNTAAIARLRAAYNALLGTHALTHGCPLQLHPTDYQVTFISPTRQITATLLDSCEPVWTVTANRTPIDPALQGTDQFRALITRLSA